MTGPNSELARRGAAPGPNPRRGARRRGEWSTGHTATSPGETTAIPGHVASNLGGRHRCRRGKTAGARRRGTPRAGDRTWPAFRARGVPDEEQMLARGSNPVPAEGARATRRPARRARSARRAGRIASLVEQRSPPAPSIVLLFVGVADRLRTLPKPTTGGKFFRVSRVDFLPTRAVHAQPGPGSRRG
jgi:hypothetical protein